MKLPYDDGILRYDILKHRYIPTEDGVADKTGIILQTTVAYAHNSNPSAAGAMFCDFVSQHLYNYIYRHGNSQNRWIVEYALAKDATLRQVLAECLMNEVRYIIDEGAFWNKSGVNIGKGAAMDLSTLRDTRAVSYETEGALWQPIPVLGGVSVLYRGIIPVLCDIKWREDY